MTLFFKRLAVGAMLPAQIEVKDDFHGVDPLHFDYPMIGHVVLALS